MTRLFVVRHGQTDWNVARRLQGASDIPLNDVGRAQARAARAALWAELTPEPVVVSSHLGRAVETAALLCEGTGTQVHTDPRLAERAYGVWEGLEADKREIEYPEEFSRWQAGHEPRIEGYETHAELAARVREATDHWVSAAAGRDVVFVSHGSAGRMLLLEVLGLPLVGKVLGHLENASWSRMVRGADGRWSLDRHNVGAPALPAFRAGA